MIALTSCTLAIGLAVALAAFAALDSVARRIRRRATIRRALDALASEGEG